MRLILPLPGNEAFASRLAQAGNWELGKLESRRFPDNETYVRINADVANRSVDLVCTLARPDEGFLRLIFAADCARSLGAREVTLIAPYLAYMRQDRRFQTGEAVTSQSFARLISSTFDRLVTVDPHLHRYPALSAIYTLSSVTLHAAPLLADWIGAEVEVPLVIGPDEESEQWVSAIAARIGAPFVVLRKIRHGDRSVDVDLPDLSQWKDRQPVLVDDIVSSGQTMIEAAQRLPNQGFRKPVCAVVHGVFANNSFERLRPLTTKIASSDTIAHPTNAFHVAPLIASALPARIDAANLVRHRRLPEPTDEVEQAGIDSFPASDAPSWTGGAA